ncbi:hypothetical protein TrCOL_g8584 [Triparma columacea]|uniref:Uncharacterized protein n=1 Tax=Triparma columacea TaxID=722753 RepID=A0A9W7GQL7_9STRA|nr:hypothetical protein TrCOL_g8584 [Triparma columacea]
MVVKNNYKKARKPSWIDTKTPCGVFGFAVDENIQPQVGGFRDDGKGWYIGVEDFLEWKLIKKGILGEEVILDGDLGGGQMITIGANSSDTHDSDNIVGFSQKTKSSHKKTLPRNLGWAKYQTSSVFGFIVDDGFEEKEKAEEAATAIQLWFKRRYIKWALRERKERRERMERQGG